MRADVTFHNTEDSVIKGFEISAGLPLYTGHTYHGVFLEPGIVMFLPTTDTEYTSKFVAAQVLVGGQWSWDNGFNAAAAIGIGQSLADDGRHFLNGYLRFGYSF